MRSYANKRLFLKLYIQAKSHLGAFHFKSPGLLLRHFARMSALLVSHHNCYLNEVKKLAQHHIIAPSRL